MKRTLLQKFFAWTCVFFLLCSGVAFANPSENTIRILENRTAFHWGRDCFVWVVHYSETLVDPWVDSEAGRLGMSDSERDSYKDSFIADLSIGTAEPVLVTVHAFGARPLNFSPFSEKIALITPNGERIKPTKYDKILDQSMSGVVQGLVFFPKQNDPGFAITISGMGVYDERVFSFTNVEPAWDSIEAVTPTEEEIEIIVVELPPAPKPNPSPSTPPRRESPPPPPQPTQPPEPDEPIEAALKTAGSETSEVEVFVLEPNIPDEPDKPVEDSSQDVAYSSREHTLRTFLDLWVKFDLEAMYCMLSGSSQKKFTIQTFEAELKKSQDFRTALRGGYTIDWLDSERAKIVVVKRILVIRTLLSRTLGVTREGTAWKIVW